MPPGGRIRGRGSTRRSTPGLARLIQGVLQYPPPPIARSEGARMDATFALSFNNPDLANHAEVLARPVTQARRMADTIRALAIDAAEHAQSGYPVLPVAMADVATSLWTRFHKFDAADPRWPDRDRFVLSAGRGSLLLYTLLHLTGHDGMSIDDIRN